jgi:hypothetical protein
MIKEPTYENNTVLYHLIKDMGKKSIKIKNVYNQCIDNFTIHAHNNCETKMYILYF